MRQLKSRQRIHFTLLELLLVISIMVILMSILLPALKKSKDMANQIKCTGNLKQLGIAVLMYANDFKYFPQPLDSAGKWWQQNDALNIYINSTNMAYSPILFCPSASPSTYPNSYTMYMGINGKTPSRVKEPSIAILIVDGINSQFWDTTRWRYLHSGGSNFLFVDGHVQWNKLGTLTDASAGY